MNKIIYYTKNNNNLELLKLKTEELLSLSISIIQIRDKTELFDTILSVDKVVMIIYEPENESDLKIIEELKIDESFKYLPVLVIEDPDCNYPVYSYGIEQIINKNCTVDQLAGHCTSLIKYKIKIDESDKRFSELSELNFTKSIQLDLIRKFIPQTVWNKCEDLANHQSLIIQEEEKELSFIYADLESFTSMSENMKPKEVIDTLNLLFDIVTQIVYQNFGDVDKFIGDAFLAIFDSADMALLTSIMIQSELETINKNRSALKLFPLKLRMGVHYGKVIRGSVGGTLRFDNTLIGDPINTTQRLEGMSPSGGILASKDVIKKSKAYDFSSIRYDKYFLKGKNKEIEAALLYDYYTTHTGIIEVLFKYRKQVEKV